MKVKNEATKLLSGFIGQRDLGGTQGTVIQEFEKMTVTGELVPDSVNLDERSIEIVFTTGEAGKRFHWEIGEYIEELDVTPESIRTARLDKGLSVCDNHDVQRGVEFVYGISKPTSGGVQYYTIANGELRGTVVFGTDPDSDKIWQKVSSGILRHWSLGYEVHEFNVTMVDGQLPIYRAVDWTPLELSIVPVSFETTNGSRSKPKHGLVRAKITHCEESEEMKTQRNKHGLINDPQNGGEGTNDPKTVEQQTRGQSLEDPAPVLQPAAAPAAQQDVSKLLAQRSAEQSQMTSLCRNLGVKDTIVTDVFGRGGDIDAVRAAILAEAETLSLSRGVGGATGGEGIQGGANISSGKESNQRQMEMDGLTNLLLSRTAGNADVEVNEFGRQFTGMGMMELARHVMAQRGEQVLNMGAQAFAQRVFMSTSDFPLIFENVLNKNLRNHYEAEQQTWRDLCQRATVRDFRDKHLYQVGDAPDLLPLGENGEYRAGTFGEAKEKYNISTFARSIGMSRQMFINDDMGALDMFPRMWGSAASRLESDIVWGLILDRNYVLWNMNKRQGDIPVLGHLMSDGKPIFHADHGNLRNGANGDLSATGLSALRQDGHKTKTIDGNRMPVKWGELVLPYELEDTADQLLAARMAYPQTPEQQNIWAGKLGYRVEPRLSDVSSTAWLAFAAGAMKAIEYAYLEGNEGVYTEQVMSTDVDGMKSIVRHDFGAGAADYRYLHKSVGQ